MNSDGQAQCLYLNPQDEVGPSTGI